MNRLFVLLCVLILLATTACSNRNRKFTGMGCYSQAETAEKKNTPEETCKAFRVNP